MKSSEYKAYKGIRKESLRDNMTDIEVLLTDLGEIPTRDIAKVEHPQGFEKNMQVARKGGQVANDARKSYEKATKNNAISNQNALNYQYIDDKNQIENKQCLYCIHRVALIRTLATKPDLILLDEPLSALDYVTRLTITDEIYSILKEMNVTVILISHDIAECVSFCNRIVVLSKRPAIIKNIYNINLEKNLIPSLNRKDKNFYIYYDLIWGDQINEY